MSDATRAHLGALRWLRERNGTGVLGRDNLLLAAGERAGVRHTTWSALMRHGYLSRDGRRLTVTEAGAALDLDDVKSARSLPEDACEED